MQSIYNIRCFFIFFLLSLSLYGHSQRLEQKKSGDSSHTKDTIVVPINDTTNLTTSQLKSNYLKVIVAKEKESSDYIKYILPVFTLLLGILVNRGLDYFRDRKKIKRAGRRWVAELSLLNTPIENQIEDLESFQETLTKDIYQIPSLHIYPSLKGEIFNSLDKTDLLRYIELYKSKDYNEAVSKSNKVVGTVDILFNHYQSLKDKFNEFLRQTSANNTLLTSNLQSLLKSFSLYGVAIEQELQGDPTNDPRYKPLGDLFSAYIYPKQESGDYDVYFLKDNFFIPLIKELGHLRHDERTYELAHFSTACLNNINAIKAEKGYMIKNAQIIKERYQSELTTLAAVLTEIR